MEERARRYDRPPERRRGFSTRGSRRNPDPRTVRLGLLGLLVVALVIFGAVKLFGDDDDNGGGTNAGPIALSESELAAKAGDLEHAVYWVGPMAGTDRYELTTTEDGRIYVRYLTPGAEAGDPAANFLSVGTYFVKDASDALTRAQEQGGKLSEENGFSLLEATGSNSAYVVFDDQPDLQIEIFDPKPGSALELAKSGKLQPLD